MRFPIRTLGVLTLLVLLPLSLANAQDDYRLPTPTGPYGVGITRFHWVDEAREEEYTPNDPDDRREIMVDVWYPADVPEGAETAPYMLNPEAFLAGLQTAFRTVGTVTLTVEAVSELQTNSYADAPLAEAEARYPVVIFSHGLGGASRIYSAQMEMLASHGFIVASIDHPYISCAVTFPDGRIVMFERKVPSTFVQTATMAGDQRFVLDQLQALNDGDSESMFMGRLDLEHVGVFGHSAGGFAAAESIATDERFKAAIVEDGEYLPAVRSAGSNSPVMHMASEEYQRQMRLFNNFHGGVYNLTFDTFGHTSFTDAAIWSGDRIALPFFGSVERSRALPLLNAYVLAFFDQTLKGSESPLLQGASADYPEVIFEMKAPD